MYTNWEQFILIDRGIILEQLNHQYSHLSNKLVVRGYTIKASGTSIIPNALAEALYSLLPYYVYGKEFDTTKDIIKAVSGSIKFFGKKDPDTDGKYGELLLYALVESVLGCKMIAHKIRTLTNVTDQVKGGDGIFMGNYQISSSESNIAYLIGESKITQTFATALDEAYKSINRFHSSTEAPRYTNTELIVAKENLFVNDSMSLEAVEELYNRLTPSTEIYKEQIIVHPVLIMYDSKRIPKLEIDAKNQKHLEELIKMKLFKDPNFHIKILEKMNSYSELKKYYFDFFIIPNNSIKKFRDYMYYEIHGVEWK